MTQFGGTPFGDPFGMPTNQPPAGPPPVRAPRPDPSETNTLATLSVVFAFVFAPAGAILGHLGLGQIAATGQRGRDRALAGITLSYFFITVAVVSLVVWATIGPDVSTTTAATSTTVTAPRSATSTTTTTTPPPPPAPTVDPAQLTSILLTVQDLQTLLGEPGLAPIWASEGIALQPRRGGIQDPSCAGSFFKGTPTAYAGNEPLRFTGTDIGDSATGLLIGQGAAVYPDAAAAQKALAGYRDYWRACAYKSTQTIPVQGGATPLNLLYGAPVDLSNGMTQVETAVSPVAAGGGTFMHVIAVRSNVLVDNIFISPSLSDTSTRVTQAMIDRIPR
ncbi:MAG TPA: sensor domain-containing protein [Mycobacterium sp.]